MILAPFALLLAQPASDIVVTARPLSRLQTDLAACIKRACPPDEDISAALAYAEAAFVAGDYKPARQALSAAIGRNRAAASDFPEEMSDLYRAYATVSRHLGEADTYRNGTWNIERTTKRSAKATAEERLAARIEVADMQVSTGDPRSALDAYSTISRDARRMDMATIAATSDVRLAKMLYAFDRKREGRALLIDLSTRPGPTLAPFRLGARLLLQQIDHPDEKPDMSALAADPGGLPTDGTQALIWSPPADPNSDEAEAATDRRLLPIGKTSNDHEGESFDGKWVDVGFHVNPDGTVQDVQLLRSAEGKAAPWAKGELLRIAGRLYSPLKPGTVSPIADRTERLTYTSRYVSNRGWKKRSSLNVME